MTDPRATRCSRRSRTAASARSSRPREGESVGSENEDRLRRRSRANRSDPGRAVAFSDAIIAIVITLLVLDLRPPDTKSGELLAGLLAEWPTYLAYAASYVYLAVIWMNHKAAFTRIREMDIGLQWANL